MSDRELTYPWPQGSCSCRCYFNSTCFVLTLAPFLEPSASYTSDLEKEGRKDQEPLLPLENQPSLSKQAPGFPHSLVHREIGGGRIRKGGKEDGRAEELSFTI